VEFDATDRLAFNGDVQYVKATASNFDYTLNTQVNPSSLSIDLSGNLPSVSANPGGYLEERDNFFWAAGMDDTQSKEAQQFAARFSLAYSFDAGFLQAFRAGVRFGDRGATTRDTGDHWQPIGNWWMGDANGGRPGQLASLDEYVTDHTQ